MLVCRGPSVWVKTDLPLALVGCVVSDTGRQHDFDGNHNNQEPTIELLLLRHAKSSWSDPHLADHDRPLNKRGRRDAPRMGRKLVEENLLPDVILTSTANRACTTAHLVASSAEYSGLLATCEDLYHASPADIVAVLAELAGKAVRPLIVGHNPGLEDLLYRLTGSIGPLPTAALAWLTLPIEDWRDLAVDTPAELMQLWRPKELD